MAGDEDARICEIAGIAVAKVSSVAGAGNTRATVARGNARGMGRTGVVTTAADIWSLRNNTEEKVAVTAVKFLATCNSYYGY